MFIMLEKVEGKWESGGWAKGGMGPWSCKWPFPLLYTWYCLLQLMARLSIRHRWHIILSSGSGRPISSSRGLSNSEQWAFCSCCSIYCLYSFCTFLPGCPLASIALPVLLVSLCPWCGASTELVLITLLLMLLPFKLLVLLKVEHTVSPRLIDFTALFCSLVVSGCHFLN